MRDIMFRGKQVFDGTIGNNEMIYGDLFTSPNGNITYIITKPIEENGFHVNKQIKVERETVSQFTEMYDKNERRIYEGDVLKVLNRTLYKYVDVFFNCGSWEVRVFNEPCNRSLHCFLKDNDCIVVGNIFDEKSKDLMNYEY